MSAHALAPGAGRRRARRQRVLPGVAHSTSVCVVSGGDALRARTAQRGAEMIRYALRSHGVETSLLRVNEDLPDHLELADPDYAFPSVLGGGGAVSQLLELLDLPYVGPDAGTVRTCADKRSLKQALRATGVATPNDFVLTRSSLDRGRTVVDLIAEAFNGPLAVKPARVAGGLGVKRVATGAYLPAAVCAGMNHDSVLIVEPWIHGREYAVLLVGDGDALEPLGTAEAEPIKPTAPVAAAWGRAFRPAEADSGRTLAQAAAADACAALHCRDYALVDVVVDGDDLAWVVDVDVEMPFTPDSKVAAAAVSGGLDLAHLIWSLCRRFQAPSLA